MELIYKKDNLNFFTLRFTRPLENLYRESNMKHERNKLIVLNAIITLFVAIQSVLFFTRSTNKMAIIVYIIYIIALFGFLILQITIPSFLLKHIRVIKFLYFIAIYILIWAVPNSILEEEEAIDQMLVGRMIYCKEFLTAIFWTFFYEYSLCLALSLITIANLLLANRIWRTDYYLDDYVGYDVFVLELTIFFCLLADYMITRQKKLSFIESMKYRSAADTSRNTIIAEGEVQFISKLAKSYLNADIGTNFKDIDSFISNCFAKNSNYEKLISEQLEVKNQTTVRNGIQFEITDLGHLQIVCNSIIRNYSKNDAFANFLLKEGQIANDKIFIKVNKLAEFFESEALEEDNEVSFSKEDLLNLYRAISQLNPKVELLKTGMKLEIIFKSQQHEKIENGFHSLNFDLSLPNNSTLIAFDLDEIEGTRFDSFANLLHKIDSSTKKVIMRRSQETETICKSLIVAYPSLIVELI